jgi:hypothetical protein
MSKIVEIQPGVLFVPTEWESQVVAVYDTRTITVSQGINGLKEIPSTVEKKEEEGRGHQGS